MITVLNNEQAENTKRRARSEFLALAQLNNITIPEEYVQQWWKMK